MAFAPNDPIVTVPVVTPITTDDCIDYEALAGNVQKWLKTPLQGFIVGSASGQEWYLSEEEKLEIARTVRQNLDECRFLIGGIDCPSVTETLRRAEAFVAAGADVVRIRIPRDEPAVLEYFDQVLPRCPCPVLLMHQCNPERFGFAGLPAASPEVLAAVCNREEVFGYVTDHDVRFEARVRRLVSEDKRFWICNGSLILSGTLFGCNGTTTAFANVWPAALQELLEAGMAGRYEEARPLQEKVQRIDAVMLELAAVGVKVAMELLGFEGMRSRQPISSPSPEWRELLRKEMVAAGLLPE